MFLHTIKNLKPEERGKAYRFLFLMVVVLILGIGAGLIFFGSVRDWVHGVMVFFGGVCFYWGIDDLISKLPIQVEGPTEYEKALKLADVAKKNLGSSSKLSVISSLSFSGILLSGLFSGMLPSITPFDVWGFLFLVWGLAIGVVGLYTKYNRYRSDLITYGFKKGWRKSAET